MLSYLVYFLAGLLALPAFFAAVFVVFFPLMILNHVMEENFGWDGATRFCIWACFACGVIGALIRFFSF